MLISINVLRPGGSQESLYRLSFLYICCQHTPHITNARLYTFLLGLHRILRIVSRIKSGINLSLQLVL